MSLFGEEFKLWLEFLGMKEVLTVNCCGWCLIREHFGKNSGNNPAKHLKHPLIFKEGHLNWDCSCSQASSEVFGSGPVISSDYLSASISFCEVT